MCVLSARQFDRETRLCVCVSIAFLRDSINSMGAQTTVTRVDSKLLE